MQCKLLESMILIPWRPLTVDTKLLAMVLKEETDRAGLRLRRRQWHPTPVLEPEKSHGRRSLVGCSPWGR